MHHFIRPHASLLVSIILVSLLSSCQIFNLPPSPTAAMTTPINPLEIQQTQVALATQQKMLTQWAQETQEAAIAQGTLATEQTASAQAALETQSSLTSSSNADIIWMANHESGDIRAWLEHGGFVRQGSSGDYQIVNNPTHSGSYAVGLTIDTSSPSETGSHAAYLFVWDEALIQDEAYYSAWFYFPAEIKLRSWWNIFQWKSTANGNSSDSDPIFIINVAPRGNGMELELIFKPDKEDKKRTFKQNILQIPSNQWFQIEAFYKRAQDQSGQVIIWQDGDEIFNVTGLPTVLADNTIYWSINNYSNSIEPYPCTIYIDDAAISKVRLGPAYHYSP